MDRPGTTGFRAATLRPGPDLRTRASEKLPVDCSYSWIFGHRPTCGLQDFGFAPRPRPLHHPRLHYASARPPARSSMSAALGAAELQLQFSSTPEILFSPTARAPSQAWRTQALLRSWAGRNPKEGSKRRKCPARMTESWTARYWPS